MNPQTKEHYPHDICPKCGSVSVPYEGVPDQSLRGCPECKHTWSEDLDRPAITQWSDKPKTTKQASEESKANGHRLGAWKNTFVFSRRWKQAKCKLCEAWAITGDGFSGKAQTMKCPVTK